MLQRYRCTLCGSTFSPGTKIHLLPSLKEAIVRQHLAGKASYRELQRANLSKKRANEIVLSYAHNAKTTTEIARELQPQWSGYLIVDGKVIKAGGRRCALLLGVDRTTDVPHTIFEHGPENKTGWMRFFRELRDEIGYELHGVASDGNPDIRVAARAFFPGVTHQLCLWHVMRAIDRSFGYAAVIRQHKFEQFTQEIELRNRIYDLLYAPAHERFDERFRAIFNDRARYTNDTCKTLLRFLVMFRSSLTAHFNDPHLPRTTNLAENTIRQYHRRLKLIEGFQTSTTAEAYLRLYTTHLRFRPFSSSRIPGRNGKSRLQIAGVETRHLDWLRFSQRPSSSP